MLGLGAFLYTIFISAAWIMTIYTLNFYYLSYQSRHNQKHEKLRHENIQLNQDNALPVVTIQLPLFNEKYVARRLIDAVCKLDYPKHKLQIQVIDDSDDETVELIKKRVDEYQRKGFDIVHLRRNQDRSGYKAGALKDGMKYAKGEFIAIFDADFVPPYWFLKKTLGHFVDPKVGLIQCRWGHINENYSTLTAAQAVSLDLHFLIEQKAKSLSHLFMNFNGTAGIWRSSCINDAGGWHTGTLVEDLDLSYRAQMKGWKSLFLEDVVVDAELPVQMNAAKRQQFRWAKGSIQVALKLLLDLISERKLPVDTKVQAFIQLTRHVVHPLFLIQFIVFPILLALDFKLYTVSWAPVTGLLIYVLMGPATYLYIIRKIWGDKWKDKAKQYLFLIFFATGISVNNTVAVFDALLRHNSEFLRTPKFGILKKGDDWKDKEYVLPFTKTTLLEAFFGLYGCIAIFISIFSRNPVFVPIIAIQTVGFIYIAYFSMLHSSYNTRSKTVQPDLSRIRMIAGQRDRDKDVELLEVETNSLNTIGDVNVTTESRCNKKGGKNSMTSNSKIVLVVLLGFLAFGAAVAYAGYQITIYPIDKALGYLSRSQSAQTPEMMTGYIKMIKALLPMKGNAVWSFPNPRTDFGLIQDDLNAILSRTQSLSSIERNSAAYNTGLEDLHGTLKIIESNLEEASPYLYVSFTNVLLSCVWITIILLMFFLIMKKRTKYTEYNSA